MRHIGTRFIGARAGGARADPSVYSIPGASLDVRFRISRVDFPGVRPPAVVCWEVRCSMYEREPVLTRYRYPFPEGTVYFARHLNDAGTIVQIFGHACAEAAT